MSAKSISKNVDIHGKAHMNYRSSLKDWWGPHKELQSTHNVLVFGGLTQKCFLKHMIFGFSLALIRIAWLIRYFSCLSERFCFTFLAREQELTFCWVLFQSLQNSRTTVLLLFSIWAQSYPFLVSTRPISVRLRCVQESYLLHHSGHERNNRTVLPRTHFDVYRNAIEPCVAFSITETYISPCTKKENPDLITVLNHRYMKLG